MIMSTRPPRTSTPSRRRPTPAELAAIVSTFTAARGYSPTTREIAARAGIGPAAAAASIEHAVAAGALARAPGVRTVTVAAPAPRAVARRSP
jgi:hypothetical protein